MRTSTLATVALLALAVVAVAGGAAAGGASTGASAAAQPHDNGIGANYTVVLPNTEDHYPGTQGGAASIWHLSAAGDAFEGTSSPRGLKRMDALTISNQDIVFAGCTTENTAAFGLDYGNNDSGTTTDEGLLSHRENSAFKEHSIFVDFYGPDSLAGSPVRFDAVDQIVAVQTDCYDMPSEPGWYQIDARVNGTGYDGNYIDTNDQGDIFSHYFYICECDSEQEAREQLGPPPSDSGGDGTTSDSGGSTATATPTATPAPDDGGSGGSGGSGDGGTATATATAAGGDDTGGQQVQQQDQSGGVPATPTVGAGPGFGLVAALGGVLAVALLARRRG